MYLIKDDIFYFIHSILISLHFEFCYSNFMNIEQPIILYTCIIAHTNNFQKDDHVQETILENYNKPNI